MAICERMTRVGSALSAVLFAFPPAKGTMLDNAGEKKETRTGLTTQRVGEQLHYQDAARFRYLFKCPPCPSATLDFKDVSGSFVQVRLQFLL